jgi:hypothetical protein
VLNSSLVYNPQGERVARYDKIHLFGFRQGTECYDESATIEAGRQPVAFNTPFGRVGLSICYDLRFPELYRALGVTDLLVIPAAFTETTGRAHWEILLRARAIENQCYVLAVQPRVAGTRTAARRTATACSSTPGERSSTASSRDRESSSATSNGCAWPKSAPACRRSRIASCRNGPHPSLPPLSLSTFPLSLSRCRRNRLAPATGERILLQSLPRQRRQLTETQ